MSHTGVLLQLVLSPLMCPLTELMQKLTFTLTQRAAAVAAYQFSMSISLCVCVFVLIGLFVHLFPFLRPVFVVVCLCVEYCRLLVSLFTFIRSFARLVVANGQWPLPIEWLFLIFYPSFSCLSQ